MAERPTMVRDLHCWSHDGNVTVLARCENRKTITLTLRDTRADGPELTAQIRDPEAIGGLLLVFSEAAP